MLKKTFFLSHSYIFAWNKKIKACFIFEQSLKTILLKDSYIEYILQHLLAAICGAVDNGIIYFEYLRKCFQ